MKKEVKAGIAVVFLLFFVFLVMQFSKVFIYYDDFGYLSLSYGNTVSDVAGSSYTLPQLIEFMGKHYFESNGRLFYLFLFCFIYMLGGLTAVQVFMAASVLAILILVYYVVIRQTKLSGWQPLALAVFICLLYGTLGISIQRNGTYWYAASFLYVVPAVTFLLFAIVSYDAIEKADVKQKIACIILAFLAAFSQEEWLVAVIGYTMMLIAVKVWRKYRVGVFDIAILIAAVAGALPILTSPAVRMRLENNSEFAKLSLIEKVIRNIRIIIDQFFSLNNRNYLAVMAAALVVMAGYMIIKKFQFQLYNVIYFIVTLIIDLYLLAKFTIYAQGPVVNPEVMIWVLFVYMIMTAVQVIRFLADRNQVLLALIFMASVLTLACLVIVPELPHRVLLPFFYLSYALYGYLFCLLLLERKQPVWGLCGLLFIAVLSIPNLRNIYRGYQFNYHILSYNDEVIRENVKRVEAGEDIKTITVYWNPDPICSGEMVYDNNFSFMVYWMNQYYDLSNDIELDYQPITDLGVWLRTH